MQSKMVSIGMATYNGEKFLSEQLDSIFNQTFTNFELIICDDNSTDNTIEIIKRYSKQYTNIKLYQNSKRLGFVKNFEKVISLSQGDYIALSDQDDIWYRDKLKISIENLEKLDINQPTLFHSDLEVINDKKELISKSFFKMRSYRFPKDKAIDIMVGRCGVMGNSIVFNQALKSIILPFPKDLQVHDYWIALVNELFGKRITYYLPLLKYRIHSYNISNSIEKLNQPKKLNSNIRLPFHNINRERVLLELLDRYRLSLDDKEILNSFLDYLLFNRRKIYFLYLIFRYRCQKSSKLNIFTLSFSKFIL